MVGAGHALMVWGAGHSGWVGHHLLGFCYEFTYWMHLAAPWTGCEGPALGTAKPLGVLQGLGGLGGLLPRPGMQRGYCLVSQGRGGSSFCVQRSLGTRWSSVPVERIPTLFNVRPSQPLTISDMWWHILRNSIFLFLLLP